MAHRRKLFGSVLVSAAIGCGAAPTPPAASLSATEPARPALEVAPSQASTSAIEEVTELQQFFAAERVTGTIALYDTADGVLRCSDLARCRTAALPASTFKIPNSLIALETAVLESADSVLPWDGTTYPIADWNQEHTLRTAIRVSCVPCFQWIARRVGQETMQAYLDRFDYGNHNMTGGIDRFWLNGGLRITPLQQIEFLRRLDGGKLPIEHRSLEIVRDIITLDVGQSHVFRGKTGWAAPPDVARDLGWFVGWVELDERRIFFATMLDGHDPDVEFGPLRRRLTETILRSRGLLPS